MKLCFVADFFADEVNGGGELNNEELIGLLSKEHEISKIKSQALTPDQIDDDINYIIANFIGLSEDSKSAFKN